MHCLIFPNLFYFFSFVVFVEKCSGTVRIIHRFHKNHQTTKKEKPICGMKFQNKRGNVKNGIFKFIFSLSLFAPVVDCVLCGKTPLPQRCIDCVFACFLCMGRTRFHLAVADEYAAQLSVRLTDFC